MTVSQGFPPLVSAALLELDRLQSLYAPNGHDNERTTAPDEVSNMGGNRESCNFSSKCRLRARRYMASFLALLRVCYPFHMG